MNSRSGFGVVLMVMALALVGCGDGGDGSDDGGESGVCERVGEPIELPHALSFEVAAGPNGEFVVVGQGYESRIWQTHVIDADDTVQTTEGGPGGSPVALADGEPVRGFGPGLLLPSTVALRPWEESAWGEAEGGVAGPPTDASYPRAADIAVSADGTLALGWTDSQLTADGEENTAWVHVAEPGGGLGEAEAALTPDSNLREAELHLAMTPDGAVHVLGSALEGDEVRLIHRVRAADGSWQEINDVGPAPGMRINLEVTGLAAAGDDLFAAEVHPESTFDDTTGAMVVYRWADGAWTKAGVVRDERPTTWGLDLAAVGPGAVVAAVSYGENKVPASRRQDSVELHHCTASGCSRAVTLADTPGGFYQTVKLATVGAEGLAVWAQDPRGGEGAPSNMAQRFRCAP